MMLKHKKVSGGRTWSKEVWGKAWHLGHTLEREQSLPHWVDFLGRIHSSYGASALDLGLTGVEMVTPWSLCPQEFAGVQEEGSWREWQAPWPTCSSESQCCAERGRVCDVPVQWGGKRARPESTVEAHRGPTWVGGRYVFSRSNPHPGVTGMWQRQAIPRWWRAARSQAPQA